MKLVDFNNYIFSLDVNVDNLVSVYITLLNSWYSLLQFS